MGATLNALKNKPQDTVPDDAAVVTDEQMSYAADPSNMNAVEDQYYEDEEYVDDNFGDNDFGTRLEEEEGQTKKMSGVATALIIAGIVLFVAAAGLLIYNLVNTNSQEKAIKDWVANYLYECVSEEGAGLLTNDEIARIAESVTYQMKGTVGAEGFSVDDMTEEQMAELVAKIRESVLDQTNSLTTSDVQTISQGVVERVLKEQGITELAAANGGQVSDAQIKDLESQIKLLQKENDNFRAFFFIQSLRKRDTT